MDIKVLGTRGEIEESAPYHARQSGILIDDILLLDCGDQKFLEYDPRIILITHLHPDHAFFVRHRVLRPPHLKAKVYAPEKFGDWNIIIPQKHFYAAGYRITPIPTVHSIKVKSHAYLIANNKKTILYTGDMVWIDKKYHHMLKNIDLVITEASFMRKGGMVRRDPVTGNIFGHTGVPNLIRIFKPYTDRILFVHFGSWFYKNMKKARQKFGQLAKENAIEIIVGYDGFTIIV
jgi:ribonuclease BN (tRNA processing enzyme)